MSIQTHTSSGRSDHLHKLVKLENINSLNSGLTKLNPYPNKIPNITYFIIFSHLSLAIIQKCQRFVKTKMKKKEPCSCPCTSIPRILGPLIFSRITIATLVYAIIAVLPSRLQHSHITFLPQSFEGITLAEQSMS